MNTSKTWVALLALLLAAMAMVPLVSAADTSDSQMSSDSARFMNWAYQNEGKVVTAAQCLEISAPGYWANLSVEKKKAYSEITVEIPNFHSQKLSDGPVSATAQPVSRTSGIRSMIVYIATANSATSAVPGAINYWASTSNTPTAFPVTNIIAQLCRWDGSQWVIADQGTVTDYYTTFSEVWKNKLLPSSGQYKTYSQHYGDFPPNAEPSVYYITRWSNQVTY
ncbi:hypothetical protein [Methanoregula sp.]|uniref:hypothetical protein n=1 Tax=Methanoregula sp. TaxID=2052170 RepID=UPI002610D47B|nr:hypothetical protein [Methanoregula sp.]MDD5142364.1 hypothetical protein [Methanoregula sp.]